MPSGSGVFVPGGQFTFIRSYIAQFNVNVNTPVTQDGRTFTFFDGGDPTRQFVIRLRDEVFEWSSNRYTLDFVIEDSYYTDLIPPFTHAMSYALVFDYGTFPGLPTITFLPFSLVFGTDWPFRLDHLQPVGYWRPFFPGHV